MLEDFLGHRAVDGSGVCQVHQLCQMLRGEFQVLRLLAVLL